jgi:hypothetical protein
MAAKFLYPDHRLDPKLAIVAFAALIAGRIGKNVLHFIEGVEPRSASG